MKKVIYSNRLETMFNNLNSNNFAAGQLKSYEKDLHSIRDLQQQETDYIQLMTHSESFYRNKRKHTNAKGGGNQISDVALGSISNRNLNQKKKHSNILISPKVRKEETEKSKIILESLNTKLKTNMKLNYDLNRVFVEENDNKEITETENENQISTEETKKPRASIPKRRKGFTIDEKVVNNPLYSTRAKPMTLIELRKKELMDQVNKIIGEHEDEMELKDKNIRRKTLKQSILKTGNKRQITLNLNKRNSIEPNMNNFNNTLAERRTSTARISFYPDVTNRENTMNKTTNKCLVEYYPNDSPQISDRKSINEKETFYTDPNELKDRSKNTNVTNIRSELKKVDICGAPIKKRLSNIDTKFFNSLTGFFKLLDNDESPINKRVNEPKFKNTENVNNFIIRDFAIGQNNGDGTNTSRKRMEVSQRFFYDREEKKKQIKIEKMKEYEMKTGRNAYVDEIFEKKENSFVDEKIEDKEVENFKLHEEEYKKKINKQAYEKSQRVAQLIEEMGSHEYEKMNDHVKHVVNKNNLNRVIRLRNILKTSKDPTEENLAFENMAKFKESSRMSNNKVIKALQKLGPPSFLKTRFKKGTVETYNIVNGKYFGCLL